MNMSKYMERRRKNRLSVMVPTSSMGDIAFLLIIFFMLTSKFMKESHIEYKSPDSPEARQIEDSSYSVVVDRNGVIFLQGHICGSAKELQSAVERLVDGKKDAVVMLKIDRNLREKQFGSVLESLSKAGVKIAMVGDKSKKY